MTDPDQAADAAPDQTPEDGALHAFERHDHGRCRAEAMDHAAALAAERGLRLTPARKRALEILLESHRALGAYEVLERLAADGLGDKPPVAYRALDFLVSNGLAHRIEKLNAFVACAKPDCAHAPAFLICRECRRVAETAVPDPGLSETAATLGFAIETRVVEATGLCPDCRAAQSGPEGDA